MFFQELSVLGFRKPSLLHCTHFLLSSLLFFFPGLQIFMDTVVKTFSSQINQVILSMLILVLHIFRRDQKLQSSFALPKDVPEPKVLIVFFLQLRSRVRLSGFSSWPGRCSWWSWTRTPSITPPNWGRPPSPPSSST